MHHAEILICKLEHDSLWVIKLGNTVEEGKLRKCVNVLKKSGNTYETFPYLLVHILHSL